jgi:PadR family transcriptional regulator PadR
MILAVLSSGALHGYAIAREVERRSDNVLTCQEGILYPALRALEREELVSAEWEIQSSGPARKVYTLTKKGRATLTRRTRAWEQFHAAMGNVLGGKPDEQTA